MQRFNKYVIMDVRNMNMRKNNLGSYFYTAKRQAFTLAEVVIAMLIVSIVVGVCIKITKAKLNNISAVNYYTSYSTLKSISTELFSDFKLKSQEIINSEGACYVKEQRNNEDYYCYNYNIAGACTIKDWDCNSHVGEYGITASSCNNKKGTSYGKYMTQGKLALSILSSVTDKLATDGISYDDKIDSGFSYDNSSAINSACTTPEKKFLIVSKKTVTSLYSGANFCTKFLENTNTASSLVTTECNGSSIATGTSDFSSKTPDFVLRNGMKFYNFSKDPVEIDALEGNSKGQKYTKKDGTEIDLDEWGYIIYVDIDGDKGRDSTLWKDVYKFYITLSGTVIPAYDSDNPGKYGGDSTNHLQTSVSDQYSGEEGRVFEWVTKSKSFKVSACTMGLVNEGAQYCNGVTPSENCLKSDHDCKLKTIMPVKFFN